MAEDADGNYYYDAGTVNELFDNVDIVEDSDGNLSLVVGGSEVRVHNLAHVFGAGGRADPTTDELAQGESMMYVDDSSPPQFVVAYNDSGSIVTNIVDTDLTTS